MVPAVSAESGLLIMLERSVVTGAAEETSVERPCGPLKIKRGNRSWNETMS